jgi:hypothetical protein
MRAALDLRETGADPPFFCARIYLGRASKGAIAARGL